VQVSSSMQQEIASAPITNSVFFLDRGGGGRASGLSAKLSNTALVKGLR